jgi:peptidoglycan-associated lipoprotein
MKLLKSANLLLCVLALAIAGCKPKPGYITPLGGGSRTGDSSSIGTGGKLPGEGDTSTLSGIPANPAGSHQGWGEDASILKPDTVYFAFDSSVVRSEERSKVQAVADHLKSNPANAVRIVGNCDERGTAEYNRALGERRALAVREELAKLGIDASRVDTISYGFDRPASQGHDESSWKMNRRDEFILLSPPK